MTTPARQQHAEDLFDYLVMNPQGATVEDMCADLALGYGTVKNAIQDLRSLLGDTDDVALPATSTGPGRWIYTLETDLDPCRPWVTNRIMDSETRLRTINATVRALARSMDTRTKAGRRVKVLEKGTSRIIEDLNDLEDDL